MKAIIAWFFAPTSQSWAVLCRLGFGLWLFISWFSYLPYVQHFFGPEGIGGVATMRRLPGSGFTVYDYRYFLWLHYVDSPGLIWLCYGLLIAAILCFTVGFCTRISGVLTIVLHALFIGRMPFISWGGSHMLYAFTIYTVLADAGRYVSLDAWLRSRRCPATSLYTIGTAPAWPKRLLQVHVCTMYAVAGLTRLNQPGWLEGSMVYVALTNLMFARADIDWNPWRPLLRPISYCIYVLEPLATVLLWLPTLGRWVAVTLISLHVGLELTSTNEWNVTLIVALFTFLPDHWLRRPFDALQRHRAGTIVHHE